MFSIFNKAKGKDFYPDQFNTTNSIDVSRQHTVEYFAYYIYIVTDKDKKKMNVGMTGALSSRLHQLEREDIADSKSMCIHAVYWESFSDLKQTLIREKEIKRLSKKGRKALITKTNPNWKFLNERIHNGEIQPVFFYNL